MLTSIKNVYKKPYLPYKQLKRPLQTKLVTLDSNQADKNNIKKTTDFCMALPQNRHAHKQITPPHHYYSLKIQSHFDVATSQFTLPTDQNTRTPLNHNLWFQHTVSTILKDMRPNESTISFTLHYMLKINQAVKQHRDPCFDTCVLAMGLFKNQHDPIENYSGLNLLIEDRQHPSEIVELPQTPPGQHYVLFEGFRCLHYTKHQDPDFCDSSPTFWRPQISIHIINKESMSDGDL